MSQATHIGIAGFEMPEAFRDFAEKGAQQTKEIQERFKRATDDATALVEQTFKVSSAGATELNRKIIENARSNMNAVFDHAFAVMGTKSVTEALEVSAQHARKQFEAVSAQTKELATLVQKLSAETTEPVR